MFFINWDSKFSLGIEELDDQHADLINWVNHFYNSMGKSKERHQMGILLTRLSEFSAIHFPGEETLMEIVAFPFLEDHRNQHIKFSAQIEDFRQRYEQRELLSSADILGVMRELILDHIQNEDQKLAEHIDSRAVGQARYFIIRRPDFSLGDKEYNARHDSMIRLFNLFHVATILGEPAENVSAQMDNLVGYLHGSFFLEEELMQAVMYPGFENHRNSHEKLIEMLPELQEKIRSDHPAAKDTVLRYLHNWMIGHIRGPDREYVEYVTRKGISKDKMFVVWDRYCSVGIDEMDSQHMQILQIINRLYELEDDPENEAVFSDMLNTLINTIKTHFFAEENLMRRIKYMQQGDHKKEHDLLTGQLHTMQKQLLLGQPISNKKFAEFIRDWFLRHIQYEDSKYGGFFAEGAQAVANLFAKWEPEYGLGIADLDREHKNLLNLLCKIHYSMTVESERENIDGFLARLARDTKAHFGNEEKLMTDSAFPQLNEHKREHLKLLKQVMSLQIWSRSSRAASAAKDLRLIRGWMIDHIRFADRKFSEFMASRKDSVTA
jgi:hemerythrin